MFWKVFTLERDGESLQSQVLKNSNDFFDCGFYK